MELDYGASRYDGSKLHLLRLRQPQRRRLQQLYLNYHARFEAAVDNLRYGLTAVAELNDGLLGIEQLVVGKRDEVAAVAGSSVDVDSVGFLLLLL